MKLLDIISLGVSFLSVVVSVVALIISRHKEKFVKDTFAKSEESTIKKQFGDLLCEIPRDCQTLTKKRFARFPMGSQIGTKVYKKTGHNRTFKIIVRDAPNNAHEAYRQLLITYLKNRYPETEEECILRISEELQKSQADVFLENLSVRAEEIKERIVALEKGISD